MSHSRRRAARPPSAMNAPPAGRWAGGRFPPSVPVPTLPGPRPRRRPPRATEGAARAGPARGSGFAEPSGGGKSQPPPTPGGHGAGALCFHSGSPPAPGRWQVARGGGGGQPEAPPTARTGRPSDRHPGPPVECRARPVSWKGHLGLGLRCVGLSRAACFPQGPGHGRGSGALAAPAGGRVRAEATPALTGRAEARFQLGSYQDFHGSREGRAHTRDRRGRRRRLFPCDGHGAHARCDDAVFELLGCVAHVLPLSFSRKAGGGHDARLLGLPRRPRARVSVDTRRAL